MSSEPTASTINPTPFEVPGRQDIESTGEPGNDHRALAKHTCVKCGKHYEGKLKQCSVCRSASYCSRECQVAHYKAHKKTCASFFEPPIVETFNVDRPDEYPLFGAGYHPQRLTGLWITYGRHSDDLTDRVIGWERVIMQRNPSAFGTIYLRILVQNRNRATPITVFGGDARAVPSPDGHSHFQQWDPSQGDGSDFILVEGTWMRSLKPIWNRVTVISINGQPVEPGARAATHNGPENSHLGKILSHSDGTVLLSTGDFVVMEFPFRGSSTAGRAGQHETFRFLKYFQLPCIASSSEKSGSLEISATRLRILSPPDDNIFFINGTFDSKAVREYYANYAQEGLDMGSDTHSDGYGSQAIQERDKMAKAQGPMSCLLA